jgi:hypothetical protein
MGKYLKNKGILVIHLICGQLCGQIMFSRPDEQTLTRHVKNTALAETMLFYYFSIT